MSPTNTEHGEQPGPILIVVTIGWIILFAYLLLTSDPPDLGPIRLRSFEDPGHLFGSLLLGFLVFLVIARWGIRPGRAAFLSLAATLVFLGGLEVLQELRPGRGYQQLDIQLNLAGSAAGVALAWIFDRIRRNRQRQVREHPPQPSSD